MKQQLYRTAKNLATQLGYDLSPIRSAWRGSTTEYWKNEVINYRRQIQKRRQQKRSREIKQQLKEQIESRRVRMNFDRLIEGNSFQEVVREIVRDGTVLTNAQANNFYNRAIANGRYVITLTEENGNIRNIALNETTRDFIIQFLKHGLLLDELEQYGSDTINAFNIRGLTSISISLLVRPEREIRNRDGRFFPHINTTNLDLSNYQIYNQEQTYALKGREHCLIHTLLECGVSKEKVNEVKMTFKSGCNFRKKDLKSTASIIKKNIVIHSIKPDGKIKKTETQKGFENINIAIHENHYFKFEETKYTKFFINNYKTLNGVENNHNIIRLKNNKPQYGEGRKINSLLMVEKLLKANLFGKMDMVNFEETASHQTLKEHIYLDNIDNEQQIMKQNIKIKAKRDIYYADCESYVSNPNNLNLNHSVEHKLQLLGVSNSENDFVNILNVCDKVFTATEEVSSEQLVVYEFLKNITKNGTKDALCYFHNLKYDYHLLEQYINIKDKCEKDNQIYSVNIKYKGKLVELRDSFKLIPFALSKFQKEFGLPEEFGKKEAISYEYYTKENNDVRIKTDDYRKLLSFDDQKIFDIQMKNEPSFKCGTFNPMDYYKEYLRLDCLVLKKGVEKFNTLIQEITEDKMNVFDCLTISSLTDKYMIKEGAYDGIYEVKGNLRAYIAKAVYGGRVAVNKKYQKKVIEGKISDYDGVSLYPSAINRLCREIGLPEGKAKRFDLIGLKNWRCKNYSILTVKINKVNKHHQIPFIAHKSDSSILYTNEPPEEEIIIDSITLEDWINFHKIEYEVLDGVYWNDGVNKKMGEVIQRLFNARLKYKKTNTALANVIKLMLNSSYGKTIMKKANTETKIIKTSRSTFNKKTNKWKINTNYFKNYVYNNFNTIKSYRKLNADNYSVEKICSDNSYNRGHIGCAILSMSKRIMNEVFDVANDNNYIIYYTDTDSLHCNMEDVPKLEAKYKERFNKELNGKELEQFHTDFNLDGACDEIYATKSIFLGKKSYMDVLESVDADGNKITGTHIRLKGITPEGAEHTSKEYDEGYFGLYKDLAIGTKKKIILNPFNKDENKNKVLFEFKQGRVFTRKEFIREVKF